MKANIGMFDRFIRAWLGVIIAGIGIMNESPLALLGLIPFVTAIVGTCPLYSLLKFKTNKSEEVSGF